MVSRFALGLELGCVSRKRCNVQSSNMEPGLLYKVLVTQVLLYNNNSFIYNNVNICTV